MRRKVIRAKLHDIQVVIPGIGNAERDLPPVKKHVPMDMYIDSEHQGLMFVRIPSGNTVTEFFVPLANVQLAFLEPEAPKPTTPSAIATSAPKGPKTA